MKVISWVTLKTRHIFYRKGFCMHFNREIKANDCTECEINDTEKLKCFYWKRNKV